MCVPIEDLVEVVKAVALFGLVGCMVVLCAALAFGLLYSTLKGRM